MLDLGGGSTQITFLPRAQVTSPAACPGGVPALLPLRDLVPVQCHLDLWARDWGVGPPSPACPLAAWPRGEGALVPFGTDASRQDRQLLSEQYLHHPLFLYYYF